VINNDLALFINQCQARGETVLFDQSLTALCLALRDNMFNDGGAS